MYVKLIFQFIYTKAVRSNSIGVRQTYPETSQNDYSHSIRLGRVFLQLGQRLNLFLFILIFNSKPNQPKFCINVGILPLLKQNIFFLSFTSIGV